MTVPRSPEPSSTATPADTPAPTTNTPPAGLVCPEVADVVLILDQSTSIVYARGGYDNWYKYILGFARGIVDAFDIGPTRTQVGVVKFSENAEPSIYLYDHQDKASLSVAIQSLDIAGGETNIASACRMTRVNMYNSRYGAREGVKRIVVMLTDGEANRERNSTLPEADLLKAAGAEVFTIGITDRTDAGQLKEICSEPSDQHYFYVDDYSQLATIQSRVIASVCNQLPNNNITDSPPPPSTSTPSSTVALTPSTVTRTYTAAPTSTSSPTTQSTTTITRPTSIQPSTSSSPTLVPSTTTTTVPPLSAACPAVADVVIVLDQSTSIVYAPGSYSNWYDHILGFAKNLSSSFLISPTKTRVGVVKFSGNYSIAFYLNTYDTTQAVVSAIGNLDIEGGETNIAAALRIVRTKMCTAQYGHRDGVKCAIVLVTDGEANREANMTQPEAQRCKDSGIEIFTLGMTSRTNPVELQSIASVPVATHYYYVDDYQQLNNVVKTISKNVCDALRIERSS